MRSPVLRVLRRFRHDGGANLVEAALIFPVLILLVYALFEFAIILYIQMALQNGVNQGARFAITRSLLPDMSREQSIRKVVKDEIPSLKITDANISFSHMGLSESSWSSGTGPANSVERVTVTYTYPIMSIAMKPFFGNKSTLTFTAHATMKNEGDPES